MNRNLGLTLLEVLVALAVISVAFFALAMVTVNSLNATTRTRFATETKAAANRVLEAQSASVLFAEIVSSSSTYADQEDPDPNNSNFISFWFIDYYYSCPNVTSTPSGTRDTLRTPISCEGSHSEVDSPITTNWVLEGRSGVQGEGIVDIVVTANHEQGTSITLGNTITYYDVFPSPKRDTPLPCPPPTATGGGR